MKLAVIKTGYNEWYRIESGYDPSFGIRDGVCVVLAEATGPWRLLTENYDPIRVRGTHANIPEQFLEIIGEFTPDLEREALHE